VTRTAESSCQPFLDRLVWLGLTRGRLARRTTMLTCTWCATQARRP